METDATQDDFQDVDDAELENILSERDVLDIMKALDDDGKYCQILSSSSSSSLSSQ